MDPTIEEIYVDPIVVVDPIDDPIITPPLSLHAMRSL